MKAIKECYTCLTQLLHQSVELATEDPELRAKVIDKGVQFLDNEFSTEKTTIDLSTPLHRLIRDLTGNPDPYDKNKKKEVEVAFNILQLLGDIPTNDLMSCIIFAVRGNSIDFFKETRALTDEIMMPVEFAIDETAIFENKLPRAKSILYLADNAGEVPFDLPLVRLFENYAPVTYVVKESPVQNDITLADIELFDMAKDLPRVISTGTDTPGVIMEIASREFRSEFEAADLILAKGMGYWETLSELPKEGKVFHLLKAKCQPVANSLGVTLNSYVAILR